eukprot:jgi/Undpi1/3364/HiC_scaffold_15.g06737.m1
MFTAAGLRGGAGIIAAMLSLLVVFAAMLSSLPVVFYEGFVCAGAGTQRSSLEEAAEEERGVACWRWGEGEAKHPVAPANEGQRGESAERPPAATKGARAHVGLAAGGGSDEGLRVRFTARKRVFPHQAQAREVACGSGGGGGSRSDDSVREEGGGGGGREGGLWAVPVRVEAAGPLPLSQVKSRIAAGDRDDNRGLAFVSENWSVGEELF